MLNIPTYKHADKQAFLAAVEFGKQTLCFSGIVAGASLIEAFVRLEAEKTQAVASFCIACIALWSGKKSLKNQSGQFALFSIAMASAIVWDSSFATIAMVSITSHIVHNHWASRFQKFSSNLQPEQILGSLTAVAVYKLFSHRLSAFLFAWLVVENSSFLMHLLHRK